MYVTPIDDNVYVFDDVTRATDRGRRDVIDDESVELELRQTLGSAQGDTPTHV